MRTPALAFVVALAFPISTLAQPAAPKQPSTRELERINWMELREFVPARSQTVLLPLGHARGARRDRQRRRHPRPAGDRARHRAGLDAFVAPVIPYGFTGSMDAYPGAFTVPEDAYRAYVRAVLVGLARNGFRNIVMVNGHGGGQTAILSALAQEVGREERVRMLVVNWWAHCADVTQEVFGEDGGHAGDNETAFMQAIDPTLVHPERYTPDMALANPAPGRWSAYPNPTTIGLYKAGQGYPKFDAAKAKVYFRKVCDKVAEPGEGHDSALGRGRALRKRSEMSSTISRREFVKAGTAASVAASVPAAALGQAPTLLVRKATPPVVIASSNGHEHKNGGPRTCVEEAWQRIAKGEDVLDSLIAGVNIVELDPADTSVGYGGLPNADGVVQLDSCCMHGPRKRAGGVAALEGVRTPSRVAKAVLDHTDHHLLVGPGAQDVRAQHGLRDRGRPQHRALAREVAGVEAPHRPGALPRPEEAREAGEAASRSMVRDGLLDPHHRYGTINCDGVSAKGELCGVTTTSGLAFKIPGRVGDSPILGAGLWVDDEVGAAGSTGRGEANLYNLSSFFIVEELRRGRSAKDAGMAALAPREGGDRREAPARQARPAELPAGLLRAHEEGRVRGRLDVGQGWPKPRALRGLHRERPRARRLRPAARRSSRGVTEGVASGARRARAARATGAPPLFTARFFMMCGFTFTVFLSLFQLLPTAPFRILDLGGSNAVAGLFLGLLTYASALSAPITGALADRIGKRRMLLVTSLAIAGFSLAYAASHNYWLPLVLVLFHGLFWSGLLSASAAYMTEVIPESRRAEGIGYWGMATMLATAVSPGRGPLDLRPRLGLAVPRHGVAEPGDGRDRLAAAARHDGRRAPEPRPADRPGSRRVAHRGGHDRALPVLVRLRRDHELRRVRSDELGIAPRSIFFTAFALTVFVTRVFSGRLADRVGHRRFLLPCLALVTVGAGADGARPHAHRARRRPRPCSASASATSTRPSSAT